MSASDDFLKTLYSSQGYVVCGYFPQSGAPVNKKSVKIFTAEGTKIIHDDQTEDGDLIKIQRKSKRRFGQKAVIFAETTGELICPTGG